MNAHKPFVTLVRVLSQELRQGAEKTQALLIGQIAMVLADAHHGGMLVEQRTARRAVMHFDDGILVFGAGARETAGNDEINPCAVLRQDEFKRRFGRGRTGCDRFGKGHITVERKLAACGNRTLGIVGQHHPLVGSRCGLPDARRSRRPGQIIVIRSGRPNLDLDLLRQGRRRVDREQRQKAAGKQIARRASCPKLQKGPDG